MASRACLVAVNRTIRSAGLAESGADAAICEQARNLARLLDAAGPEGAPLNLLRLYDSALTKLQRAADRIAAANRVRDRGELASSETAEPSGPPVLTIVEESPLERIRRAKRAAS